MKKSKFTETQIVKAINEHEAGRKAGWIFFTMGFVSQDSEIGTSDYNKFAYRANKSAKDKNRKKAR